MNGVLKIVQIIDLIFIETEYHCSLLQIVVFISS